MKQAIERAAAAALTLLLIALPLARATAQDAAMSPEELHRLRKEAARRTRRIIFDNDGNEPVYYCDKATAQNLLEKRTLALLGTQVDTMVYCTWSSGFSIFTHNTKVGQVFACTAEEPGKGPGSGFSKNKTQAFIDQGTDPLAIMTTFCRDNDIEIFWSMRMNDIHDAWGAWYSPFLFPELKKAHPDWLLGSKEQRPKNGAFTAVDYSRPEIRDLAFRFFQEVCQHYDVDGVELDFFRHLNYFPSVAQGNPASTEELDMMTDLLRRIRRMTDDVGLKRGRPILISVRVPDSEAFCKVMGFDITRWMAEDLIDLMAVSGYFRLNPWETSVELGHRYGVPVYPCLSETRIKDAESRRTRSAVECYRGRAMEAWDAGADGIYLFNFFNPNSPLWRELGARETLEPLDKVYTTAARGLGNISFWYKGGERFANRSLLTPANPRTLEPGQTETITLCVGEDPSKTGAATLALRLRFQGIEAADDIAVTLNGAPLTNGVKMDAWIDYALSPDQVQRGDNRVDLTLGPNRKASLVTDDLLLWVRHGQQ